MHDPLTGLPNRALLHDRAAWAIAAAQRSGRHLALLLLDLNRFKEVNDTLGHHVGDELLQQVGPRLQPWVRASDTLARLGGDEFAILLPEMPDVGATCAMAGRLVEALSKPFAISGLDLEIGVSIGVAFFPQHGLDLSELMQRADVAMYAAKRDGLGFGIYDAEADTNSVRRLTLQGDLRRAIEDGRLILHYQPKVDTRTNRLVGFEALMRWQHPSHGLIPPNDFVPFAEQTGLIRPLTTWLLRTALEQWRAWNRQGFDLSVAVNLSAQSLDDPELIAQVQSLLASYECPAAKLNLEITETTLMAKPDAALAVLSSLADLQCRLSLDDFGTGYSSLSYLQRLPIHELKIDRSFVMSMEKSGNAAVIVLSIINLGHSLDLAVVAEGVESRESYDALCKLGCEQIQGYFVGRPMPPEGLEAWLGRGPWTCATLPSSRRRAAIARERHPAAGEARSAPHF
jgi:diguanylate cyclase (GGDEF)-like protein